MVHEHSCKILYNIKLLNAIAYDKQVVKMRRPGRSKMTKMKLIENNCHDWNFSEVRSDLSAMPAALV